MSDHGHDLHSEFPGDEAILNGLKLDSGHFQTLSRRYHAINKDIVRAEQNIDPTSDERMESMKKMRLAMLDEIAMMIADARKAA